MFWRQPLYPPVLSLPQGIYLICHRTWHPRFQHSGLYRACSSVTVYRRNVGLEPRLCGPFVISPSQPRVSNRGWIRTTGLTFCFCWYSVSCSLSSSSFLFLSSYPPFLLSFSFSFSFFAATYCWTWGQLKPVSHCPETALNKIPSTLYFGHWSTWQPLAPCDNLHLKST